MNQITCEGNIEFAHAASKWCDENIRQHNAHSVFLPAGNTPIPLYNYWTQSNPTYLKSLRLKQIDDVLTGEHRGVFREFFLKELPKHREQMVWIDGPANDEAPTADLAILGLGLNGHIAFHEPGLPTNFYSGCVRLTDKTRETLGLEENAWGITYGAEAFMNTKAILMIVNGASKKEVVRRLLAADPTLPASRLLKHPRFTLLVEASALP